MVQLLGDRVGRGVNARVSLCAWAICAGVILEAAWIELGLEEGLGDGRNSPSTERSLERRGPSTGSIAAGIPVAIISAVKRVRTKINHV